MSRELVETILNDYSLGNTPERDLEKIAVQWILKALESAIPGKSVELRIPPHAVISVIEGPVHRRGTPRAVVEMNAETLFHLALGVMTWDELDKRGKILASGERSNLSTYFPL